MVTTVALSRWTAEGKKSVQEILTRIKALARRLSSGGIRRINVREEPTGAVSSEVDRLAAVVLRRFGLLAPAPRLALARRPAR